MKPSHTEVIAPPCDLAIYIYIYICIYGCGSKPVLSRAPPALLQTFVAGPLLQTLVADLCVEYCSLQGACRGGVCRRTPPSVTNLCREMATQACYKANVFDSLSYVCVCACSLHAYGHVYIHTNIFTSTYVNVYVYPCMCTCIYIHAYM